MAGAVPIKTRKLTREQLSRIATTHEGIRFLEDLQADVTGAIPAAIVETELTARFSLQPADGSKSQSFNAQMLATEVQALVLTLSTQRSAMQAMQRQIDDLQSLVIALTQAPGTQPMQAQIDSLSAQLAPIASQASAISNLRRDIEDVRALLLTTGI